MVVILATFITLICGLVFKTFSFDFVGLIGWVMNLLGLNHKQEYSVIDLAYDLPPSAENPNSSSIRFTQVLFFLIAIVLPIVLESVTNTTFMNINPTVAVFYHGEHVMEEGAGLNQKALVFAYPHLYKSNILFAHPVLTQIAIKPSCQYLANFNTKYSVVLISLLHIKH